MVPVLLALGSGMLMDVAARARGRARRCFTWSLGRVVGLAWFADRARKLRCGMMTSRCGARCWSISPTIRMRTTIWAWRYWGPIGWRKRGRRSERAVAHSDPHAPQLPLARGTLGVIDLKTARLQRGDRAIAAGDRGGWDVVGGAIQPGVRLCADGSAGGSVRRCAGAGGEAAAIRVVGGARWRVGFAARRSGVRSATCCVDPRGREMTRTRGRVIMGHGSTDTTD